MKEASLLLTVQLIICRIEVEGDLAGRGPMRLEKQIDEQLSQHRGSLRITSKSLRHNNFC